MNEEITQIAKKFGGTVPRVKRDIVLEQEMTVKEEALQQFLDHRSFRFAPVLSNFTGADQKEVGLKAPSCKAGPWLVAQILFSRATHPMQKASSTCRPRWTR